MNSLRIPDGGMPFTGDDLTWMQNSLQDAIRGVSSMFGTSPLDSFILWGVVVTGTSVSQGWAVIQGELVHVKAFTLNSGQASDWYIEVEETYDVSGNDQFADGVQQDTYVKREGVIKPISSHSGFGSPLLLSGQRAVEWVSRVSTVPVTLVNGWSQWVETGNFAQPSSPSVSILPNKEVYLSGQVTGGTSSLICTLPVGMRPADAKLITCGGYLPGGSIGPDSTPLILVRPSGEIEYFSAVQGTYNAAIDLSAVRFRAVL